MPLLHHSQAWNVLEGYNYSWIWPGPSTNYRVLLSWQLCRRLSWLHNYQHSFSYWCEQYLQVYTSEPGSETRMQHSTLFVGSYHGFVAWWSANIHSETMDSGQYHLFCWWYPCFLSLQKLTWPLPCSALFREDHCSHWKTGAYINPALQPNSMPCIRVKKPSWAHVRFLLSALVLHPPNISSIQSLFVSPIAWPWTIFWIAVL